MTKLEKGMTAPLHVTREAAHRVFVGLGWDPKDKAGLLDQVREAIGGKPAHHDLDLSCYIFSAEGRVIGEVSARDGFGSDQSGKIYHSGDSLEGVGEGDDEQISAELKDLDPIIHTLIFTVASKSGHKFGEITAPQIRLGDGYTDRDFLKIDLGGTDGEKMAGFIFIALTRQDKDEWIIRHIGEYLPDNPGVEWPKTLKTHL